MKSFKTFFLAKYVALILHWGGKWVCLGLYTKPKSEGSEMKSSADRTL